MEMPFVELRVKKAGGGLLAEWYFGSHSIPDPVAMETT